MLLSAVQFGEDDRLSHPVGACVWFAFAVVAAIVAIRSWRGDRPALRWRLFNLRIGWAGWSAVTVAFLILGVVSLDPARSAQSHAIVWVLCLGFVFLFGIIGDLIAVHGKDREDPTAIEGFRTFDNESTKHLRR